LHLNELKDTRTLGRTSLDERSAQRRSV